MVNFKKNLDFLFLHFTTYLVVFSLYKTITNIQKIITGMSEQKSIFTN